MLGLYNTAQNGMRTFSGVTIGVGGSLIGVHWSLGLSAAVLFVLTLVVNIVARGFIVRGARGRRGRGAMGMTLVENPDQA